MRLATVGTASEHRLWVESPVGWSTPVMGCRSRGTAGGGAFGLGVDPSRIDDRSRRLERLAMAAYLIGRETESLEVLARA